MAPHPCSIRILAFMLAIAAAGGFAPVAAQPSLESGTIREFSATIEGGEDHGFAVGAAR